MKYKFCNRPTQFQSLTLPPGMEAKATFPNRRDPKDNEKPCLAFSFGVSRNFVSAHGLINIINTLATDHVY